MDGSFDSEHKVAIREYWNKPLLKFLSKRVNDRLTYVGLPSPKAEDIMQWIEYIKSVIAFQCREYGEASDEAQERKGIEELNSLLNGLERSERIDNYVVYDGYLEEVILRGYDNSPTRIDFSLDEFITLYNLDFCNKITSPIEYLDANGNEKTAYKFEALHKLVSIQRSLRAVSKKFVLFLTVHCSYDGDELNYFINNPPTNEIRDYITKCNSLRGHEKNSRIIRLFFAHTIQNIFSTFGFTPKILPCLYYNGLGGTPLLHFTVLGIEANRTAGLPPSYQMLSDLLSQKFISINESRFVNKDHDAGDEPDVELNPVTFFANSRTFQTLWATN